MAPPPKSPASPLAPSAEEARANDIAAKSESMARELSQKREMRIRQERVRHLSSDDAPVKEGASKSPSSQSLRPSSARSLKAPLAEDRTVRQEDFRAPDARRERRPEAPSTSPPFYPDARPSVVDDVAVEIEELMRDLRAGWRRLEAADRITMMAALFTFVGVLMPWLGAKDGTWQMGLNAGGGAHAALAVSAIVLVVGRDRRYDGRGERLAGRERAVKARRASLWHLLLGAVSTLLCAYFLFVYGLQRSVAPGLQIKFGLYVTLAAGMGLSYGGFARFWGRHEAGGEPK